jgi:alanyl-tRNA synthetase
MNGNFSFGDYFKEGAIQLAWELVTSSVESGGFGLDGENLWATVYEDDDEAIELWRGTHRHADGAHRAPRLADNYWHMGVPGPGGPCSEIYYDRGPAYGPEGGPAVDEDRFMEFWNLVFMQYELSAVRSKVDFDIAGAAEEEHRHRHGPRAHRLILQGVDNMYEIDEVKPVLARAAEMTGKEYGKNSGHSAGEPPRRRAPARRRRPRPLLADAHRRRRHPGQRGSRLCPAPDAAPRGALDAPAGV